MNRKIILIIALLLIAGAAWFVIDKTSHGEHQHDEHRHEHGESGHQEEHDEGKDEHGHEHGEEEHSDATTISPEAARNLQIEVMQTASGVVQETITLTGNITLNQNKTANIKARFPGIVRSVKKNVGDNVKAGEVLAMVESNESMLQYPVKSPISGVVLARDTNVNDVAGESSMFTVTDLSEVWAEFFIFQKDLTKVQQGQKVNISSVDGELRTESTIANLLPITEASSQTIVARVNVPNPEGKWRSGMSINADVVLTELQVPVVVKTEAIQRFEGNDVVFIQQGDEYSARVVEVGKSDPNFTEIKSGLEVGETYVSKNSFVVKADIGKASAGHEH